MAQASLRYISGIFQASLRFIYDATQAYLSYIPDLSQQIAIEYQENIKQILGMPSKKKSRR